MHRESINEQSIRAAITSAGFKVLSIQSFSSPHKFGSECRLNVEINGKPEQFKANIPLGADAVKLQEIAKELLPQIKKMADLDDIATDLVGAGVVVSEMPKNYYLGRIELPENPVDGDTVIIRMAGNGHLIQVPYVEIKQYTGPEYANEPVAFQIELIDGEERVIDCKRVDELESVGLAEYTFKPKTSKVVTLKGQEFKHDEPRQDVIDMLKDLLERAESGELRSIVAVGDLSDGHLLKAFGGQPEQVMPLYAELTVAWHEFRERYIQS